MPDSAAEPPARPGAERRADQLHAATDHRDSGTEDRVPATQDGHPATNHRGPATQDGHPATNHHDPATEHHGPATQDGHPATKHRVPATQDRAGDADQRLERALALAYRHLNRRERTVTEMRRHLLGRGVAAYEAERAIEALHDQGYLDDARFARQFATDKRELDQWGAERIRRTLLERGIDRELVDEALASQSADGELERAVALLRRRFPDPVHERRERDRALGVLLRKGYDSDLALQALRLHGTAQTS